MEVSEAGGPLVTETCSAALWVVPPPTAVTVAVVVPTAADAAAVNVKVEVPTPGAAKPVGLKTAVTPDGNPEMDNETGAENPFFTVVATLTLALPFCCTVTPAGAARVKSGGGKLVTT